MYQYQRKPQYVFRITAFILILSFALIFTSCAQSHPDYKVPAIKEGKFPIYISYTIDQLDNDEVIVVQDTYVCNYTGIDYTPLAVISTGDVIIREWGGRLQRYGGHRIILFSNYHLTVEYQLGSASYYMDDTEDNGVNHSYPAFYVQEITNSGEWSGKHIFSVEELEKYGIKIIDCDLPEPIENTFE